MKSSVLSLLVVTVVGSLLQAGCCCCTSFSGTPTASPTDDTDPGVAAVDSGTVGDGDLVADAGEATESGEGETLSAMVHQAYNYSGHSYQHKSVADDQKLIAVDVAFQNYDKEFSLDDISLDDANGNPVESRAEIIDLLPGGDFNFTADIPLFPEDGGPVRVLLIYAVPADLSEIQVYFGETLMTEQPIPLAADGPKLNPPQPKS